jgi:hypothetical protein
VSTRFYSLSVPPIRYSSLINSQWTNIPMYSGVTYFSSRKASSLSLFVLRQLPKIGLHPVNKRRRQEECLSMERYEGILARSFTILSPTWMTLLHAICQTPTLTEPVRVRLTLLKLKRGYSSTFRSKWKRQPPSQWSKPSWWEIKYC